MIIKYFYGVICVKRGEYSRVVLVKKRPNIRFSLKAPKNETKAIQTVLPKLITHFNVSRITTR